MKAKPQRTGPLTINQKLAMIHGDANLKSKWHDKRGGELTSAEKQIVLDSMDTSTETAWILSQIEDVRDMRKGA